MTSQFTRHDDASGAPRHSARMQVRLSVLLLMVALLLAAWPLASLPQRYRLASGQPQGADLLITAATMGDVFGVRRALDEGVPPDALYNGCTALQLTSDPAVARLLLSRGANPSAWHGHRSPLIAAAATGNVEIAELLLQAGADPNQHESRFPSALDVARLWQHEAIVRLLLQRGARDHPSSEKEGVD